MASSTSQSSSDAELVIHHTPMSERQQLAMIKRIEKAANSASRSSEALMMSPPRAPLQVVQTDTNGGSHSQLSAAGSSSSTSSTPTSARRSSYASSPTVERLLRKISKKNTKGETPLHTAAIRGSSRLVRQLLQMGADPNAQDNAEWSPLHEACNRGKIAVVRVLREFGADLNLKGFGKDSPLHDAARNGHLEVVKFLVRSGADLKSRNASGRTPREESEVTRLRISDNKELDKTITFLVQQEGAKMAKSCREASPDFSSGEEDGDDESENDDLAKFLGITKSPVVQQAFQSLGVSSARAKSCRRSHKCAMSTPTSGRRMSSDKLEGSRKTRLTFEAAETQPAADTGSESKSQPADVHVINGEPKVPPLKIYLPSIKSANNNAAEADGSASDKPAAESGDAGDSVAEPAADEPARRRESSDDESGYERDYYLKKRKLGSYKNELGSASSVSRRLGVGDIEKHLRIRKAVEARHKNMFPVQPKPPHGYKDYLMNRKTYLLASNAHLRPVQMLQPPPSLAPGPLRELFHEQEVERNRLRMRHIVEKEKLVLAVEQEILRVHGMAARALANQSTPFSVCAILRDEEIYTPINAEDEEKDRDNRTRYNGRMFLSWLQDVDDKWDKIKEQMVTRHHNEAESLSVVQKMNWSWKVDELSASNYSGNLAPADDLHIPIVHVSDDFALMSSS